MLACGAMSPLQSVVLGAIQGVTEFLPISSSAHLYVIPTMLGWSYGGVAFDVALHMGTVIALLAAFWREWWHLSRDVFSQVPDVRDAARVTWLKLAAASMPAVFVGLLIKDLAETELRALPLQAATLFAFGFLLWWVDRKASSGSEVGIPGWGTCMLVGAAQALALVPGVSRSGITMTAGRAAELSRVSAARFSFLIGTPVTVAAGVLELHHLPHVPPVILATGVATAAIVGILAIRGLLVWLGRGGFAVFFVYRAALAAVILLHWTASRG